jgi:hypothetical protein
MLILLVEKHFLIGKQHTQFCVQLRGEVAYFPWKRKPDCEATGSLFSAHPVSPENGRVVDDAEFTKWYFLYNGW